MRGTAQECKHQHIPYAQREEYETCDSHLIPFLKNKPAGRTWRCFRPAHTPPLLYIGGNSAYLRKSCGFPGQFGGLAIRGPGAEAPPGQEPKRRLARS